MKTIQCALLLSLLVFVPSCDRNRHEIESLKEDNSKLKNELEKLQAELAEAKKENDETKKEFTHLRDSQSQLAAQEEKNQQALKMKTLIGKIISKLDRLLQENVRFSSAALVSDLNDEENRLKSLANLQKAEIGELIAELESLGLQKNKWGLERLIDQFVSNYGFYATYSRMSWHSILVLGRKNEEISQKMSSFQEQCYEIRRKVSEFKYAQ